MDVRFSNVVESTRQYFQGVPSGQTGSPAPAAAPAQPHAPVHSTPTSSPYWPPPSAAPPPPRTLYNSSPAPKPRAGPLSYNGAPGSSGPRNGMYDLGPGRSYPQAQVPSPKYSAAVVPHHFNPPGTPVPQPHHYNHVNQQLQQSNHHGPPVNQQVNHLGQPMNHHSHQVSHQQQSQASHHQQVQANHQQQSQVNHLQQSQANHLQQSQVNHHPPQVSQHQQLVNHHQQQVNQHQQQANHHHPSQSSHQSQQLSHHYQQQQLNHHQQQVNQRAALTNHHQEQMMLQQQQLQRQQQHERQLLQHQQQQQLASLQQQQRQLHTSTPIPSRGNYYPSSAQTAPAQPKKESPLDLSVKTIRQSADSTAKDYDQEYQKASQYLMYQESGRRSEPSLVMEPVRREDVVRHTATPRPTAPRVDFTPNFAQPSYQEPKKKPRKFSQPPNFPPSQNYLPSLYPPQKTPPFSTSSFPPEVPWPATAANPVQMNYPSMGKRSGELKPPEIPYSSANQVNYTNLGKRPGEPPKGVPPGKVLKQDAWRQTIDQQIEHKLNSYLSSKIANGDSKPPSSYGFTQPNPPKDMSRLYYPPVSYTQSVPSTSAPTTHVSHNNLPASYHPVRTPSSHSLDPGAKLHPLTAANGAADQRVLSILRNSLETRNAQLQQQSLAPPRIPLEPREHPKVFHSMQTKLPSFGATGLQQRASAATALVSKFPFPKAVGLETPAIVQEIVDITDDGDEKVKSIEKPKGLPNGDLDNNTAFQPRPRTKAELKQIQLGSSIDGHRSAGLPFVNHSKESSSENTTYPSNWTPKSNKEMVPGVAHAAWRLENQERESLAAGDHLFPKQVSGHRSSSEASVFDFRASDSESEMPVLERQTFNKMRKERKTPVKDEAFFDPYQEEPQDWAKVCDGLIEQLEKHKDKILKVKRKKVVPRLKLPAIKKEGGKKETKENNKDVKVPMIKDCDIKKENEEELVPQVKLEEPSGHTDAKVEELRIGPAPEQVVIKQEPLPSVEDEKSIEQSEESNSSGSESSSSSSDDPVFRRLRERKPKSESAEKPKRYAKPRRRALAKPIFGDGSDFGPGWQAQVFKYKKSLRIPTDLISISRPPGWPRGTLSLPDLERSADSPSLSDTPVKVSPDKKTDSVNTKIALAKTLGEEKSYLDRLMENYTDRQKQKYSKKIDEKTQEQAPSSSSDSNKIRTTKKKASSGCDSATEEIDSSRAKHRELARALGRTKNKVDSRLMKQKASIMEVFGADRPASAPPTGYNSHPTNKVRVKRKNNLIQRKRVLRNSAKLLRSTQQRLKHRNSLEAYTKARKRNNVHKHKIKDKSEVREKKLHPTKPVRRKLKSSGFDYIRKKKQNRKKDGSEEKRDKRKKPCPMTEEEIQTEIKTWVLNKGLGETLLHRATRLGFKEVIQYCLEKLKHNPSCRDNAGYTPLHQACSRGHFEIARLLLEHGASVSDSALGGIRPLHEAAENGYTDIIRLLLDHGADPELATYSGLTALSLVSEDEAKQLMQMHVAKISRTPPPPPPPAIKQEVPSNSEALVDGVGCDMIDGFEIEASDIILPTLYRLSSEPRTHSWVLFHEIAPLLRLKTREALLKQLGQNSQTILREMSLNEFFSKAHSRSITPRGADPADSAPKINPKVSKVTLVKYTESVKFLLGVETTFIPR